MPNLELSIQTKDALDVREFTLEAQMSTPFELEIVCLCANPAIAFDEAIGRPAEFRIHTDSPSPLLPTNAEAIEKEAGVLVFKGVCAELRLAASEPTGASTYRMRIVPAMWMLSHRTNNRIFQYKSELEIALQLLEEWGVPVDVRVDREAHPKRKYKVQYEESDFDFVSRMLEECGVAYFFDTTPENAGKIVLVESPESAKRREISLEFHDQPSAATRTAYASAVETVRRVAPGAYALRDHDYRKAAQYPLLLTADQGVDVEKKLEVFDYVEGAFLFNMAPSGGNLADSKGTTRTDEATGRSLVRKRLAAMRSEASVIGFHTNAYDVGVGSVLGITNHPIEALDKAGLLVTSVHFMGGAGEEWTMVCQATSAADAYRPPLKTPRPVAHGVESATVVGPAGEEIHVDEFGRIQVSFHWDRESKYDEKTSCWIHVSQSWAGAGFGSTQLPRIGQEVLVEFLGGDPDRPVVTGRVYTAVQTTPYALPANKTQSGWKSNSSPSNGGYNEIMMEDKAGSELFRVRAQKDQSITVLNDRTTSVGHDCSTSVGNDSNLQVGVNLGVTVGSNATLGVGANSSVSVGKNLSTTVTASCSTSSGGPMSMSTGSGMSLSGGPTIDATAKNITVTAGETLTLTAGNGASQIILTASGIIIDGPKVWVNPGKEQIANILKNGEPTLEDPPEEEGVIDQLIDQATNAVTKAVEFAKEHPEIVIAAAAPLVAPLALPLLPLALPIVAGYALSESMKTNPSPASPSFGGGGAGGGW